MSVVQLPSSVENVRPSTSCSSVPVRAIGPSGVMERVVSVAVYVAAATMSCPERLNVEERTDVSSMLPFVAHRPAVAKHSAPEPETYGTPSSGSVGVGESTAALDGVPHATSTDNQSPTPPTKRHGHLRLCIAFPLVVYTE
jgi:hypothetical protein